MVWKAVFRMMAGMVLFLSAATMVSAAPKLQVMVNNSSVEYGVQQANGRVMVPLAAFRSFKNIGLQWDVNAQKATITRDNTVIKIKAGERGAWINDKAVSLDVPAKNVDGRITVPLRFISEALGARVRVDAAANKVWIQERATTAIVQNYNGSDLAKSRLAALQMPVDESRAFKPISGKEEGLSSTYYFPAGRSDCYFVLHGDLVMYYEIKDNIQKMEWLARLDLSKEATNRGVASLFGHPIIEEDGVEPSIAPAYAYFNTNAWSSQIMYGMTYTDGTPAPAGQHLEWTDTLKSFIVPIPGETKVGKHG
ncbi:hypothetical protein GCM10010912_64380 [Paenibacillus albidus]|uniref:Copper amine oxidase-like N-terminal domain-containing protein n=1 Tax=Paenibacillus albidus TaxID=2041023 RepID=A0A917FXH8_9BACL|nr:copper amine oxidase N-terminal domain-containing protein [Paenibacillus albidus]GGG11078.1 hypothetical protein GCM10010912_64380 [Paenibacillus albidus]